MLYSGLKDAPVVRYRRVKYGRGAANMVQRYTESDIVSISFDAMVDAAELSNDLAKYRPLHRWPGFIKMKRQLADGYEALAKVPQYREFNGRHCVTFGTFVGGNQSPDIVGFEHRRRSVEINIESTGTNSCKVTARAPVWCGNFLFYILLRSTSDFGLVDPLRLLLPAVDEVRSWHWPRRPYRSVTLYAETDADKMRNWLLRRTADAWKYEIYQKDGSGFKLIPGEDQPTDDADIRISVGGLLISRRDHRGLQATFKTSDLIVMQVEALSPTRCKVVMSVSEDRFSLCFLCVLADLVRDFPEAFTATEAAAAHVPSLPSHKGAVDADAAVSNEPTIEKTHQSADSGAVSVSFAEAESKLRASAEFGDSVAIRRLALVELSRTEPALFAEARYEVLAGWLGKHSIFAAWFNVRDDQKWLKENLGIERTRRRSVRLRGLPVLSS